ncbi:MAG: hypothetical protein WCP06_04445 [Verrucomicrobiota bacterium]
MKHLYIALLIFAAARVLHATPDMSHRRAGSTPYDPYLQPVDSVIQRLDGSSPSFERVSALMREGFSFKYSYDTPYIATTPEVTESRHAGDCKAKSLWLASQMNDASVRYVIGKARRTSRISHAWLMWKYNSKWWILDPTNASVPIPANAVGADDYLVSYSYDRTGSYCHRVPSSVGRRMVAGRN